MSLSRPILLFALHRSGGSYASHMLSGGGPIMAEPVLPTDGFSTTLTENVERLEVFHAAAPRHQVVKLCNFGPYLDMLKERGLRLPPGFDPVVLFRHPYTQIASHLFTFCDWDDRWADKNLFWEAIKAYENHFRLATEISRAYPESRFLKYEDLLGEGLPRVLREVFGEEAAKYEAYAETVRGKNFKLGPEAHPGDWTPSSKELLLKEKYWIWERLKPVMEALGYGR